MNQSYKCREPTHAGSWYTDDPEELNSNLDEYLKLANKEVKNFKQIKAIIGPHAGYYYSGRAAAWSYQYLQPKKDLRVFLLGPCHHSYMNQCGISSLDVYKTPIGDIQLDKETINELRQKNEFADTSKQVEEDEHSLEMHLPFIKKMLQGQNFKLVPIMVGNINEAKEESYGKLLAPYFDDENTIFVVSSDFCHWGKRFEYQYYQQQDGEIWQSIEKLDKQGIQAIESKEVDKFQNYLKKTQNTICGRHPISVLMNVLKFSKNQKLKVQFVRYEQSSKVVKQNDSSVSYASAIVYEPN